MKYTIMITLCCITSCCLIYSNEFQKDVVQFNFITVLYNETDSKRIEEYKECLDRNLSHPSIQEVCVVYDTSLDRRTVNQPLLEYIKLKDVMVEYIDRRPTFGFLFSLANELFPKSKIIVSNADIYFNETLALLKDYDLTNMLIALTRWNVENKGNLRLQYNFGQPGIGSQDAWIFKTPLQLFGNDIEIGTGYCDSCIMHQAHEIGLTVINPCLSIQCCHLHASKSRPYRSLCLLPKGYYVPWIKLQ